MKLLVPESSQKDNEVVHGGQGTESLVQQSPRLFVEEESLHGPENQLVLLEQMEELKKKVADPQRPPWLHRDF